MKKRGITFISVAVIVLIFAILTTTISISASKSIKNAKLRVFATEISMVQEEVNDYLNTSTMDLGKDMISINLSNLSQEIISSQFEGESITENIVTLRELDLSKLKINNLQYGNKKDNLDVYAISEETLRVYYIKGYDAGNIKYYTYFGGLDEMFDISKNTEPKNIVTFTPSSIKMTNNPVNVKIKVPVAFSNVNIQATQNVAVSSPNLVNTHNEYTVNTNNVLSNYIITVSYTTPEGTKLTNYEVKNFDNTAPVISELTTDNIQVKETNSGTEVYIYNIEINDDSGKVVTKKYDDMYVSIDDSEDYFRDGGKIFKSDKIKLETRSNQYTIYASDEAGNMAISQITIPDEIVNKIAVKGIKDYTRTYDDKTTGYSYNNPPIPAGFKSVDVLSTQINPTPTSWKNRVTDYDKGLVISDSLGNEFVWVPVEQESYFDYFYSNIAISTNYTEQIIRTTFLNYIKPVERPNISDELGSIKTYGGFYVSRYEAGAQDKIATILYNNGASYNLEGANISGAPCSKKNAIVWTNIDYNNALQNSAEFLNNKYVASGLWSLLERSVIEKWISQTTIPGQSTTYSATNMSGYGNFDSSISPANVTGFGLKQVAGYSEYWKVNNIYDIAGNVKEWTATQYTENYNDDHITVDESYGRSNVPLSFIENVRDDTKGENLGYRLVLYLK